MAFLRVMCLAVISLIVLDPVLAVPDCSGLSLSSAQCEEYSDYGAADVSVERLRLNEFRNDDLDIFRSVLANVSNKYYPSITIQPQNIAIVELFEDREGVLMLSFFVMNPSNSEAFPILFRTTELTLMMELNLKFINTALPYNVDPKPVEDTYPLFFPIWAIVIIVYFLLVVMGYLIILATRNWNDKERKGSIDIDVENTDGGGAVLVNKTYTSYDQNDYAEVRKRTLTDSSQNNNITEVDHRHPEMRDESNQTPRTVSMQVRASDIDEKTAAATIEKDPDPPADGDKGSQGSDKGSEGSGSVSGEGGAVNEAFDDDNVTTAF